MPWRLNASAVRVIGRQCRQFWLKPAGAIKSVNANMLHYRMFLLVMDVLAAILTHFGSALAKLAIHLSWL